MYQVRSCKLLALTAVVASLITVGASPAQSDSSPGKPTFFESDDFQWETDGSLAELRDLKPGFANIIEGNSPHSPNESLPAVKITGESRTDFIDVDLSEVPEEYHDEFERAEEFYEVNFERTAANEELLALAELPNKIQIEATLTDLPDSIVGAAGPTRGVYNQDENSEIVVDGANYILPLEGTMLFDTEFIQLATEVGIGESVLIHEMGHVLGLGTLWEFHGLVSPDGRNYKSTSTYFGTPTNAVRMYQIEAQENTQQIPLENEGGEGTERVHWDKDKPLFGSNFADSSEIMIGFVGLNPYISQTSMEAFQDIGYTYKYSVLDT